MKTRFSTLAALGLAAALAVLELSLNDASGRIASAQQPELPQCAAESSVGTQQIPNCIEITKQTVPDGSNQVFDFVYVAPGQNGPIDTPFQLLDGQTAELDVPDSFSTYRVSEIVPPGWRLESISCDPATLDSFLVQIEGSTVFLVSQQPWENPMAHCTFTNVQEGCGFVTFGAAAAAPCLEIIKQTDPDGSKEGFPFEITGDFNDDFELEDDETQVYGPGSILLGIGDTVTISEDVPAGWTLVGIDCDGQGFDFDVDIANHAVLAEVVGGTQTIFASCTFHNEQDPEDEDERDERPRPNVGGIFGGVNTAQQNRERAGIIYPTPQPAAATAIRPPSTGDGGLIP